jgi:hypothetical protein
VTARGNACVELGRLACGEGEVLVAEGEVEPAGDHVEPFMTLMCALARPGTPTSARVWRDDLLEYRGAARVAGERQPGGAVAVNRPGVDARVAGCSGACQLVQWDMVCPCDWRQESERGSALPGFQSRQGTNRDLGAIGQLFQGDAALLAQGTQTQANTRYDTPQFVSHALSLP